ncbi:cytochrome c oxidase assembly protein [Allohahella marinimesophila]|uniref:Cytochrome c oxidase assembly protein n=1 Tax=Allohahella marinimesophila TaxID=1054972 RepID=A0ABP7NIP2_9GAMM
MNIWRVLSLLFGLTMLAIALAPPLAQFAHNDFRGHMLQHLLLGMLAPLGLVFAAPVTLLLGALSASRARSIVIVLQSRPVHFVSHPVTALLLNVGGMYLLYLTPLYAATLDNHWLHALVHIHFILAGCLFTWAIAGPDPGPSRPSLYYRLVILFISMASHATLAKLMYAYGWPLDTPHDLTEIQAGAQLMYYGGDLAELLLLIALFCAWYRAHRHDGRRRERLLLR